MARGFRMIQMGDVPCWAMALVVARKGSRKEAVRATPSIQRVALRQRGCQGSVARPTRMPAIPDKGTKAEMATGIRWRVSSSSGGGGDRWSFR